MNNNIYYKLKTWAENKCMYGPEYMHGFHTINNGVAFTDGHFLLRLFDNDFIKTLSENDYSYEQLGNKIDSCFFSIKDNKKSIVVPYPRKDSLQSIKIDGCKKDYLVIDNNTVVSPLYIRRIFSINKNHKDITVYAKNRTALVYYKGVGFDVIITPYTANFLHRLYLHGLKKAVL